MCCMCYFGVIASQKCEVFLSAMKSSNINAKKYVSNINFLFFVPTKISLLFVLLLLLLFLIYSSLQLHTLKLSSSLSAVVQRTTPLTWNMSGGGMKKHLANLNIYVSLCSDGWLKHDQHALFFTLLLPQTSSGKQKNEHTVKMRTAKVA